MPAPCRLLLSLLLLLVTNNKIKTIFYKKIAIY